MPATTASIRILGAALAPWMRGLRRIGAFAESVGTANDTHEEK